MGLVEEQVEEVPGYNGLSGLPTSTVSTHLRDEACREVPSVKIPAPTVTFDPRGELRGIHGAGNGLFLRVTGLGSRSWMQQIVIRGRHRDLGRKVTERIRADLGRRNVEGRSAPHTLQLR